MKLTGTGERWLTAVMVAVVGLTLATGLVSLRRDGPASEPISAALADQQRFLDILTRDLSRAVVTPVVMDADDEGIRITVPGRDGATAGTQTISYRYFNGTVTRDDPGAPLMVHGDEGKPVDSGPVTVSASVNDFPTVLADGPTRYRVTFHSAVRPLDATNGTRTILLPGVRSP